MIAEGHSFAETARKLELSSTQTTNTFNTVCRKIGLPREKEGVVKDKKKYLDAIYELYSNLTESLRAPLQKRLLSSLKIQDSSLLPKHLANISSSQLLSLGFSEMNIYEINDWLSNKNLTTKPTPPQNIKDLKRIKVAIALLNSMAFDVSKAKEQLEHLESNENS